MHNLSQRYGKLLSVGFSVICSVFLVAVVVSAATTIGANVSTVNVTGTGNLTISGTAGVTGLTTLAHATTTRLSVLNWFAAGGTATTTINSAGNLAVAGTASVTGLLTPTGGISTSTWDNISLGLITPGKVSSTLLSVTKTFYAGGTATTTIDAAGNLAVAGTASVTGLFTPTGGISTSTLDNISLGLVTPTKASSTLLSVTKNFYVGGTATTTIDAAGNLAVAGTGTVGSTFGVTGLTTLAHATTTRLSVLNWFAAGGTATTTIDAAGNLAVAGTASVTGLLTPTGGISTSTLDNISLGLVTPTKASSTVLSVTKTFYAGGTATTTIDSAGNLTVGGNIGAANTTSTLAGSLNPATNDLGNLGWYGAAWRDINASGTLRVGGQAATSTIDLRTNGTADHGTCIILNSTAGTTYYVSVTSSVEGAALRVSATACNQ